MPETLRLRAAIGRRATREPGVPGNDIAGGPDGEAGADFEPRVFEAQRCGALAASDDYRTALVEDG